MDNVDVLLKLVNKKVTEYLNGLEEDLITSANETNELYFKQANRIYDEFIRQYYLYETKSYIRHWEGKPGTKKGTNLYYGKNFKIHRGKNPYFELDIDASRMAGGYQRDSAAQVLDNVMNGIRGVPPYWAVDWVGIYKSRYFNFVGTLEDAIDEFLDTYSANAGAIFKRRFDRLQEKRGYNFKKRRSTS